MQSLFPAARVTAKILKKLNNSSLNASGFQYNCCIYLFIRVYMCVPVSSLALKVSK